MQHRCSVTTIDAIEREPQPEVTGAIAAPTPTEYRTSHPGGGASKVIMAAAIPFFSACSIDRQSRKTEQTSKKTEDMVSRPR